MKNVWQRTSYELAAVIFGVCVAATTPAARSMACGCTPAQDATAAGDIASLELPTQADCAYLEGGGNVYVDVICVGIEGVENTVATALHAAGQVKTTALDAGGVVIPASVIFARVDAVRAAQLVARTKKDAAK